ncbi:uncharacterized protein SAMN06298216_2212 [Spirosomataceae bacterium TFI 002]|nr:uncharacterized protein SAMN06298216_2212 [Spirosomataceae bacterium TFI 002]
MKSLFDKVYDEVLDILTSELPQYLTYHSVNHTLYVLKMAEYLAWREGLPPEEIELIRLAAIFHDIGFIEGREDHEEKGCRIAREMLSKYEFSEEELEKICGMIMATKIPQKPKNLAERVLADADLEYLSTENFEPVSEMLFKELRHFNKDLSRSEWQEIQISFLENHAYHTDFCKKYKESFKHQHLLKLKGLDLKSIQSKKA